MVSNDDPLHAATNVRDLYPHLDVRPTRRQERLIDVNAVAANCLLLWIEVARLVLLQYKLPTTNIIFNLSVWTAVLKHAK